MVAGNASRILRAPGRVVIDPTDLSTAYPYGGTEVGLSNLCVLEQVNSEGFQVKSEALGETTDILEAGTEWAFTLFLRGFDDDAVEQFFPDRYAAGGTSQHATFSVTAASATVPATPEPGSSALGRAVILLYVPDDLIHVPAVLIYRGIPEFPEGAQVAFQRREELGLPVVLKCVRDTNQNTLAVGRLADLSLT